MTSIICKPCLSSVLDIWDKGTKQWLDLNMVLKGDDKHLFFSLIAKSFVIFSLSVHLCSSLLPSCFIQCGITAVSSV